MPALVSLDPPFCARIRENLVRRTETHRETKRLIPDPFFDTMARLEVFAKTAQWMAGQRLEFHHINGRVLHHAEPNKGWHHDYDGDPRFVIQEPMVDIFAYPAGLSSAEGSLWVVPRSHRVAVERNAPEALISASSSCSQVGTEITCEPGDLVIADSAIWHRRGDQLSFPRLDLNVSYSTSRIPRPEREGLRRTLDQLSENE